MLVLKCQNCELRDFTQKELDSEEYYQWLNDYEVIKTLNLPPDSIPVTKTSLRSYVEDIWFNKNTLFFAIYSKNPDTFIGTLKIASINEHTGTADIGIMIGEKTFWGQGLGTKAVSLAAEYSFIELGLRKLTAGVMEINPSMSHCFEKIGFIKEGCFREQDLFEGNFVDHFHYGCFASEYKKQHDQES